MFYCVISRLPRDVIFHIIQFLPDGDLFALSLTCKKMCMYCMSDVLVWERRMKKQVPFRMSAMWNLIAKRYPALALASSMLSLREKSAVVFKYLGDVIDKNPTKWDMEGFDLFVDNKVCVRADKAPFFLFNVIRNPHLRTSKVKDRFFEDQALLRDTLSLFDLSGCSLFEAMHLVFGHALSLPGEAQKIDRIMVEFSAAFRKAATPEFREKNAEDALFVLAFAVVMLNSDLHNQAVKQRMTLPQFRRNLEGTIALTEEESAQLYMQVLRCEMVEGSCFVSKMSKRVWLVRYMGPLGYKRTRRAQVTVCAGELSVEGSSPERYSLRTCLVGRSVGANHLQTIRGSGGGAALTEMALLHVVRVLPGEDPDSLMQRRFQSDLILTCENIEDLKDLQRALAAHCLPIVQKLLNGTLRTISSRLQGLD